MKSQQEATNFLDSTVNLSYRIYYVDQDTRDDMSFDTCNYNRYYH